MGGNIYGVSRELLLYLIEQAEEAVYTAKAEFSNEPTEEDRKHLLAAWKLVGKDPPEFFRREGFTVEVTD